MGLLLTTLGLWIAASLGLAAVWIAVVYATPRSLRPTDHPTVFVPQPRSGYVDLEVDDITASPAPAAQPADMAASR